MLLYGQDEFVSEWVSLNIYGTPDAFKMSKAIGIIKDNKIIAGIVYNNYIDDKHGNPLSVEMSIFSLDKKWATSHNLKQLFSYPFIQLGLKRVMATSSISAEGVNNFLLRLGFTLEGKHRCAYADGGDAYSWGMLKTDCKWI